METPAPSRSTLLRLCVFHLVLCLVFGGLIALFMSNFALTKQDQSEMVEIVRRTSDVARATQAAEAFLSTYQSVSGFARTTAMISLGFAISSMLITSAIILKVKKFAPSIDAAK